METALAIHICPMCPEVRNEGPGICPSCGMALEPETITLAEEDQGNPELQDMTRRFLIALALSVPVFVIAMGGMVPGFHELLPRNIARWLEFILFDTGCSVGRLAVLRPRLAIADQSPSEHVHTDRAGYRCCLWLQPGCAFIPRECSRCRSGTPADRLAFILKHLP